MHHQLSLIEPLIAVANPDAKDSKAAQPLAAALRPTTWEEFQGYERLDPGIRTLLKQPVARPPSIILWGPPGSGKTTFARIFSKSFNCNFVEFSAVLSGVKEVRSVVEQTRGLDRPTLLFIDEIHRFNKAQQDAFLPHVENGTIILVGATTENPSFVLTNALLSRVKVVVLPALSENHLQQIIERASGCMQREIAPEAATILANFASGDARKLLNTLEEAATIYPNKPITKELIAEVLSATHRARYDRQGEEHYDIASAFIKSLRGSSADAALYWGLRMLEGGEPAEFIFRRLAIFASEDIGNADPRAIQVAISCWDAFQRVGLPEGRIPLAQCITYLASAPKSNRSYAALNRALDAIKRYPTAAVPLHLRNAPTGLLKSLGHGKEYRYPHDFADGFVRDEKYLPEEMSRERFYEPSLNGLERTILEKMRERGQL